MQIIPYASKWRTQILALQRHLWSDDESVNNSYFQWKYEQNPFLDDLHIYLAVDSKKAVGMLGVYATEWQIGTPPRTFRTLSLADLVIDPAYRNHGLDHKLTNTLVEALSSHEFPYLLDMSAAPHVALSLRMQGWHSIFLRTAKHSVMDINTAEAGREAGQREVQGYEQALASLNKSVKRLENMVRQPLLRKTIGRTRKVFMQIASPRAEKEPCTFASLDRNAALANKRHVIVEHKPRLDKMADLARRLDTDKRLRLARSETYLRWRYENPLSSYRFLFWEDQTTDGYIVLQTARRSYGFEPSVCIVDWNVVSVSIWRDLIQAVIDWGNFTELFVWIASMPDELVEILKKNNFQIEEQTGTVRHDIQGENILLRFLNPSGNCSPWLLENQDLRDLAAWDLRMDCSDAY